MTELVGEFRVIAAETCVGGGQRRTANTRRADGACSHETEMRGELATKTESVWGEWGIMNGNLFWLNDEQWERIKPHLRRDGRGSKRMDDRRVISAIVHVLKTGCSWSECPDAYGSHTAIYNRFARWARRGIWEKLFRELSESGDSAEVEQLVDSIHLKARRRSRRMAARLEGATRRSTYSQLLRDA
jgi:transposase